MTDLTELALKADAYKALRDKRLAMQKEVDQVKKTELEMRAELLKALTEDPNLRGVVGRHVTVRLRTKVVPKVTDWEALYAHIQATGEFDLLTRSVVASSAKERWEHNVEVPGVQPLEVEDLSVTKA